MDKVVERRRTDDMAEVDVTISAGGHSEQGRFSLMNRDGNWKIQDPFVEVTLDIGPLDRVTLESTHLLALPHEEPQPPVVITGELTRQGATLAQQTFKDHLDNCAKQTVGNPKACPFGAPAEGGSTYTPDVMIDDDTP